MKKGIFITFEGPEGAGKSTQIQLLNDYLIKKNIKTIITREPGGTPVAEKLRDIVKYYDGDEPLTDETEVLLFAASRAQHVKNLILPSIKQGNFVLCDRFYDSTVAYQGYARGLDMSFIEILNKYVIANCIPDITILMDIEPEKGFMRTSQRSETLNQNDRIENAGLEFHQKVRNGFLDIARKNPKRIKIVDAFRDIQVIHQNIVEIIEQCI